MKKIIIIIGLFCIAGLTTQAQTKIVYAFSQPIIDSLKSGIQFFQKLYHKKPTELRLYAIIEEHDGSIEFYLEEYSSVHISGLLNIIKTTNRKIKINNNTFIPIVIPTDKHSSQIISDKIEDLPLSGFYIKAIYERHQLQSIQTAILF